MSIFISKYTTFDELRCLLKNKGAPFIVPTSEDNEWLLDLEGSDGIFPDLRAYVWNDLYREFAGRVNKSTGIKVYRQIDPPDNRLILRYIVDGVINKKPEVLKKLPGIILPGYMEMLSDSLRELISEEVFPDILEKTVLYPDLPQQVLFEIYREYLGYLARNSLMDSAQIPARTRELIEDNGINIAGESFVFIGFLSFTNAQKNLIEEMSNNGANVRLIQPEASVDGMYDASAQFVKYGKDDEGSPLRVYTEGYTHKGTDKQVNHSKGYFLYETPDLLCELDLLAKDLALWSKKTGAFAEQDFEKWDSIGILTSPERIEALNNALSRYNIPVNLYTGKKISETPLGYLPWRVFRAHKNGWQTKDVAMLLSHVCFGGSLSRADMMYCGPSGENNWIKHMSDSQNTVGMKAFEAMTEFCRLIDKGGTPAALLRVLLEFVRKEGLWLDSLRHFASEDNEGRFDPTIRELSSAIAELERKLLFMKELQPSIGEAGGQIFKSYAAMEFFNQWAVESQTVTNPNISGAVSVYSRIPSLANFDVLIITDLTAKEWPGNLSSSFMVSEQMREHINEYTAPYLRPTHLTTLHEKRIQKEALLKRLFYSANRFVVISRPLVDDKNRPLMESPCLSSALGSKDFVNIGAICKNFSDLLPKDSPYFDRIEVEFGRVGMDKRDIPVAFSENNNKIKISALDELAECPYLYWARYIKRIKEPVTELYNSAFAGNLVHVILQLAWKEKLLTNENLSTIVSSLWDKIENNSGEEFKSVYRELFTDKRLVRRKNLLRVRVIKTAELQDEIEEKINAYAKKRTDIRFEHDVSFEMEGVEFTGRCDRLDIFEDGAVIIDYKTGKTPSSMLQLGGYAKALKVNGMEIIGVGYISLTDEKLSGTFISPYSLMYARKESKKSFEELISDTERRISSAVQVLKGGEFKPDYNSALCRYCSYKPICRYTEYSGRLTAF